MRTSRQRRDRIADHYVDGALSTTLAGAFAGLTQELSRCGLDTARATMPALTGDPDTGLTVVLRHLSMIAELLPGVA